MNRPSWDETWMSVALVIAQRSLCDRAKVGAVIVDDHNRIVASGYNGPARGYPVFGTGTCDIRCERAKNGPTALTMTSYEDCYTIHAEMNALMHADRRHMERGTLYVTGECCFTCAKAVANSGVARVVMMHTGAAHRVPTRSIDYLHACAIEVTLCQM